MPGLRAGAVHDYADTDGAAAVDAAVGVVRICHRHHVAQPQRLKPVRLHDLGIEELNVVIAEMIASQTQKYLLKGLGQKTG